MTVRTLVLLRHAKAETPGDQLDFDRRLTSRGVADAGAAGAWLAGAGLVPQVVFCSSAARTRETWQQVAAAIEGDPAVRYEDGLYAGGRTEVIDLLRSVPDDVSTVLVVGHNPTVSEISVLLRPDAEADLDWTGLKTSGLAVHRSEVAWSATEPGSLPLVERHTART